MSGNWRTEAIVLRSIRYGEADRILHLLTRERGRVNAIAKGVRRPRSRLAGRLEPLTRAELQLHDGRGDLAVVTGADLLQSADPIGLDPDRAAVAAAGTELVIRLFPEVERNDRLFAGFVRFLDAVTELPPIATPPSSDAVLLAFGLKLLALAGWSPRLDVCASCGARPPLPTYRADAGGAVCRSCGGGFPSRPRTCSAYTSCCGAGCSRHGPSRSDGCRSSSAS